MFAVRLRASIKPFLHGSYSEISAISKRILQDRFNDGKQILNSLRLSGNGAGIKLFNHGFHSSPQCYISKSNAEMNVIMKILIEESELEKSEVSQKTKSKKKKKKKKKKDEQVSDSVSKPKLLTGKLELEKSELSLKTKSIQKKKVQEQVSDSVSKPKLLTEKLELEKLELSQKTNSMKKEKDEQVSDSVSKPKLLTEELELEKSELSQKTNSMKKEKDEQVSDSVSKPKLLTEKLELEKSELSQKTKSMQKKKVHEPVSDSVSKPKLLTEKPEVPWNLNGKRKKTEAHSSSSPSRDVMDSNLKEADSRPEELKDATAEIVAEAEETCKDEMGMRISSCFKELDKHQEMQRILGKDLEILLHSVMHLENHPNGGSR